MKKLFITTAAMLLAQPAFATDYLIQYPGYINATEIRLTSPPPQPGIDCEAGSNWAQWVPVNADFDIHNYAVNTDHTLTYSQPVPRPLTPQPNPSAAILAIQSELVIRALTPNQRINLAPFTSLLNDAQTNLSGIQQTWSDMLATYGPNGLSPQPWLTQEIVTAVQNDCMANRIPLVAE